MRLQNRLKALEKVHSKHSGFFTLEELYRARWRDNPSEFRKMAKCSGIGFLAARFEREDAERKVKEALRVQRTNGQADGC